LFAIVLLRVLIELFSTLFNSFQLFRSFLLFPLVPPPPPPPPLFQVHGVNDPPRVLVPGRHDVSLPCDASPGLKRHVAVHRLCARTVSVDTFPVGEDTLVHLINVSVVDPDAEDVLGAVVEVVLDANHGTVGLATIDGLHFLHVENHVENHVEGHVGPPPLLTETTQPVPFTLRSTGRDHIGG
jgi:hypothetical protein